MRELVVFMSVTLDGVMQAPGRADEDTRGGFRYGGWAVPYSDPAMAKVAADAMAETGAMLFGRRTYEDFFSVWPGRTDNPYTEVLDRALKYVASRTLSEPLPWGNSVLLKGDVAEAVAELKRQDGASIVILGSGELVRSLMPHDLIDKYVLQVHPLVLGQGRRLLPEEGPRVDLDLVESTTTPSGVVIATYKPAE